MLRWFLSLHSPKHNFTISPKKLPKVPEEKLEQAEEANQLVPTAMETSPENGAQPSAGMSSIPPIPILPPSTPVKGRGKKNANKEDDEDTGVLPPPFTPSINKVLDRDISPKKPLQPLPEGLTVGILQSRLDTKKKIKYEWI